jgi:hypothetical protein
MQDLSCPVLLGVFLAGDQQVPRVSSWRNALSFVWREADEADSDAAAWKVGDDQLQM